MKVRITTQYGEFTAELDEGVIVDDLFAIAPWPTRAPWPKDPKPDSIIPGQTANFTAMGDDGNPTRVTMLKSIIRIVEEDL